MFFPKLIQSIKASDRVLEIGPGGSPHPRSDIFLEYEFDSPTLTEAQRGYDKPLVTDKPIIYCRSQEFPFEDQEFDYILCSHVIEHVLDVDQFVSEICRVGKAGYLEYPTIYYEYMYNFPEHTTFIKHKDSTLFWMPKHRQLLQSFSLSKAFSTRVYPKSILIWLTICSSISLRDLSGLSRFRRSKPLALKILSLTV